MGVMTLKNWIGSLIALTIFTAPAVAQMPKPAVSEYFQTKGGGFLIARNEGVLYAMTYIRAKSIKEPMYGRISFENPEDPDAPYVIELEIDTSDEDLVVQSSMISRIENNRTYEVIFELYATPERADIVNLHVDKVRFSMADKIASQMGIDIY